MNRSIEFLIAPDGSLTFDAIGFKGADCDQATKFLEQALGVVNHRAKKPEYHQSRTAKRQQRLGA